MQVLYALFLSKYSFLKDNLILFLIFCFANGKLAVFINSQIRAHFQNLLYIVIIPFATVISTHFRLLI